MAYCTQSDLEGATSEQEIIDLTDRTKSGQVDSARVTEAIEAADAWINMYVARQRAVPLSPVLPLIKQASIDEAIYILRCRSNNAATQDDHDAHDRRENWLRDIGSGKATLGVDPQPGKSAIVRPSVVTVESGDREIEACNTKGIW